jgi:hypothetical protein
MKWRLVLAFVLPMLGWTAFMSCVMPMFGCATGQPKPSPAIAKIRAQASFELQCEPSDITVNKISDDIAFMGVKNATWGVRGCGRQVIYKSSCGLGSCQVLTETQAAAYRR